MEELHAIVSGRVQLVMFRDFTQRRARKLKIFGTVQNLKDGSVEVVAQGERLALEQFLTALKNGPVLARVDSVECEWRVSTQAFTTFDILF